MGREYYRPIQLPAPMFRSIWWQYKPRHPDEIRNRSKLTGTHTRTQSSRSSGAGREPQRLLYDGLHCFRIILFEHVPPFRCALWGQTRSQEKEEEREREGTRRPHTFASEWVSWQANDSFSQSTQIYIQAVIMRIQIDAIAASASSLLSLFLNFPRAPRQHNWTRIFEIN